MQNTISERTTRRTLKQMGSSSRRPHRVPLLSASLTQFTQDHQNWTIEDWKTLPGLTSLDFSKSEFLLYCCRPCPSLYDYSVPVFWYFQQDNAQSSNRPRLVSWTSQWVHFTQMASTVTRSQSIEHLWDVVEREIHIMDVQTTNLQQLCDAIMSIWTKISEECFQHLVESMPRRIKTVLKAKEVQPGTSKCT